MTAPITHTFVDGLATSSEMNAYVRDPIAFLQNVPAAELRQTVAQLTATGVFAAITFTVEDLDNDPSGTGGHSNSVNTSRFTAQYTGWYQVSGAVAFVANAVGRRVARLGVNGTFVLGSQIAIPATAANDCEFPVRTKHVFLNVGDYLELYGFQESGGNLNTEVAAAESGSTMSVRWVRLA